MLHKMKKRRVAEEPYPAPGHTRPGHGKELAMRVLITAPPILRDRKKSGIGQYTQELLAGLGRLAGAGAVHSWYPSRWMRAGQHWLNHQCARYEAAAGRAGVRARLEVKLRGRFLNAVRAAFPVMRHPYHETVRRSGCDLYHEPNFIALNLGIPTVVSVHDLSVLAHPEWHPPVRIRHFACNFLPGLDFATRLIAISEFSKSEIVRHLGWPADRVSVTYMGVRPGLRRVGGAELTHKLNALGLPPGYLLHVGTVEPRKNLEMLTRAYAALPAAVRERHPLVLVGGPGWRSEALHSHLKSAGRAQNIRWLGYAADEHVAALYSGARALVFPTFYEGFGIPTIEMMACGGAVLASTAGAVAETAGGVAHLIDPHDEAGWRDAMLRVCTDDDWWRHLQTGTEERAAQYTWDRCARDTLEAYRLTLSQSANRDTRRAA
ncbi:glycosyltransferase family 4 protein [Gemmata sp. JC673]|uniref:Glycosyltransferase family 4 protein n=1 Tax=Gemmata algarum TaxID=2975278 RepID=A0ABU5F225_9BACT|nr:glycosyltransferase family 1 protein [Gemmata algarum]MDY3561549.1 glycosyltransferase family 4 protein [Gemmata algarum]